MTLSSNKTVREYALEIPHAMRVFDEMKIDYCCGGSKPLGEACLAAGVDVEKLLQLLEHDARATRGSRSLDFQTLTLSDLINHIVDKHHIFTKDELESLDVLMRKVISKHGETHRELNRMGELFQHLCEDLKPHMFKEERILFPHIVELERARNGNGASPFAPFGTVNNPIRMMMLEHDKAGQILHHLRSVSSDYNLPPDACMSYRSLYQGLEALEKDLHQHIHLENNILFPRAIELEK